MTSIELEEGNKTESVFMLFFLVVPIKAIVKAGSMFKILKKA